jgi:hypothetical protein
MFRRVRMATLLVAGLAAATLPLSGCQNPDDTDSSLKVDDFVIASQNPNPATADGPGTGVTYRVVRGNNQPDDILEYDWHAAFGVGVTINNNATKDSVKLTFPVTLTSVNVVAHQAAGGIITPPSGADAEYSKFVIVGSSGSEITAVNGVINMNFEVWYDFPNLRKEAVMTVTLNFSDDSSTPKTFTKTYNVKVAP